MMGFYMIFTVILVDRIRISNNIFKKNRIIIKLFYLNFSISYKLFITIVMIVQNFKSALIRDAL